MSRNYYTYDLNLASILVTLGVPLRKQDPITCVVGDDKKQTYNFWFDTEQPDHHALVTDIVRAHNAAKTDPKTVQLDLEHPFFYARAALDNRNVLVNWIRNNVEPMNVVTHGDRTLLISTRATERTKGLMMKALTGNFRQSP